MVDLTVTKEERKKEQEKMEKSIGHYDSDIPYGLHVHLDDRELKKLGLMDKEINVGSEIMATVKFRVTGLSESEMQDMKRRHVDMAIVNMDVEEEQEDKREKAKNVLYG